ncbi:MAG: hypothetical protein LBT46_03960 [Planctomycetaceae bacterium]|jgi:tetratricopeptide (TPR) repeat protein|nr:hypothetical protein [Planctomycetaceae bacterium]
MAVPCEFRSDVPRLAVGIIADAESVALLPQTVKSVSALSEHIFILAAGDNLQITEPSAAVIQGGWENDDAATRNFLIDAVEETGVADYLLWCNPGEKFDEKTLEDFSAFVKDSFNRDAIYMMVLHRLVREDGRRDDFDEETIDARLMPLRKGVRFQGSLRASLIERNTALMVPISAAPGRFIVPAKHIDPLQSKQQAEKTLHLIDQLENEGEVIADALLLYQAEAWLALDNYAAARRAYRQLIRTSGRSDLRLTAYYGFWETLIKSPIPDADVTRLLIEALDRYPVDMQLLTFLGSHLQRTGKPDLAARSFETAVQHGKVTLDVWHRLHIKEMAIVSSALSLRLLGKNQEAVDVLETYLPQMGDRNEFVRYLLDLYIQENEEEKAYDAAAMIWGDLLLDQMRLVLKGACLAKQGKWTDAMPLFIEAHDAGCRDVLCLRWYALTLLSQKEFKKAAVILDQWLAAEPNNLEAKAYKSAASQPDRFCQKLRCNQDSALRAFGIPAETLAPRRNVVRIDEAVKEIISSSAEKKNQITGFKLQPAFAALDSK